MSPMSTKLFEFVQHSHSLIVMPPKWYIDIGHNKSNETFIGFHLLGPFRDDFSRAIEKQIILTSGTIKISILKKYQIRTVIEYFDYYHNLNHGYNIITFLFNRL